MYDIRVGHIFDVNIDTEQEVLHILKNARQLIKEGKTVMSYESEANGGTLQFSMSPDVIMSECIWFLKSKNPAKYGYVVTRARQIRY